MKYLIQINNYDGDSFTYVIADGHKELVDSINKLNSNRVVDSVVPLNGSVYLADTFIQERQ